ncbi:MAG: hypothetical protein ACC682_13255 [Gemmatimonadota bacterium]
MTDRPGVFRRGIVEFVVIVFGVLVALGLESWWGARQERELEREYLQSLQEEVSRGIGVLEGVTGVNHLKRTWLDRAHSILLGDLVRDSAAVFLEGLLQGSGIAVVPQLSDAVFQDLLSTGRLAIIRDDEIRRSIVRGYSGVEAMFERQARAEENISSDLHALVSRYVPVGVTTTEGPRIRISAGPERRPDIVRAAERVAADPALLGEIRAASRALDHEANVLHQLDLTLADQLTTLEGGEIAEGSSFRTLIQEEGGVSTSGRTDSAGSRWTAEPAQSAATGTRRLASQESVNRSTRVARLPHSPIHGMRAALSANM